MRCFSALQRRPYGSQVKEHPLWRALGRSLNRHKAVLLVPADPFPVCICDDASATDFICNAEADTECFRNQRMSESMAREPPIHGKPGQ